LPSLAKEPQSAMFAVQPIDINKGIYKPELTMDEMLKVKDIPTVDRVKQSIDLVGEDQFKKMVNAQYQKYKPTDQDQEAMLVESVTLNILGKAQRNAEKTGLPTSITNKSEVKNVADDFANQFKQMGFEVTLDHSGSKAGASSYLRVSDPTTGRFLNKPIRISDHSKGAKELDANINVLNPQEDFAKITSILTDMRKMGATLVVKQDKYAQELIANGVNPKTAYQRAKTEITENKQ
jgi:competence protein ComGC